MDTETSASPVTPASAPPLPPPLAPFSPPPPPRKRGRGWMITAIILFVLLGFSLLSNLGWLLGDVLSLEEVTTARTVGPRLEEYTLREGHGSKIAVISVDGVITSGADQGFSLVELIKAQLRRAERDGDVRSVVLKVDSPGGEVLASDEIFKVVTKFQERTGKPVVCSMGSLAASGGYYIAVGTQWIVANELTITGSIGVIMSSYNYRGLMDKVGILPVTFKSGRYKDMLSGSREPETVTPEEKRMVQELIDDTFGIFKKVVADGRGRAATANERRKEKGRKLVNEWRDYADGRVLSGSEAFKLGFVDELGDFDVAVKSAERLGDVSHAKLVEYRPQLDFANLFRLFGKAETGKVKVDLGFQAPRIEAGKLYFLAPNFAQ